MTELKPCPFCGAPVGKVYIDGLYEARISCISCGGQVRFSISQDNEIGQIIDSLVSMWNRRVKE